MRPVSVSCSFQLLADIQADYDPPKGLANQIVLGVGLQSTDEAEGRSLVGRVVNATQ